MIWDGEPLSVYSQVEETWIDGIRYYSKKENELLEQRDSDLRKNIIQKILSTPTKISSGSNKNNKSSKYDTGYHCDSVDNSGTYEDQ